MLSDMRAATGPHKKFIREKILAVARFERISAARVGVLPLAPMGRPHIQPFLGLDLHPAVENAAAREHERMRAIVIDDGQLNVAVERRGGYLLPHRVSLQAESTGALT